jgi:Mor family transcriptional regulator
MRLLEELQQKDLTDDLQILADYLGIEQVKLLIKHLGGITFYIPKYNALYKTAKRFIRNNPNYTTKQYALMLTLSESTIFRILKDLRDEKL